MVMNEYKMKEEICEIGRRVYAKGFAAANDGNITVRINDKELFCTPTMVSKGYMKPDDICKVDYKGKQLAGSRKRTSEVLLHLEVYKARPDINAVVHCHPPHATAFAVAREPIPNCILPEVEVFLGEIPTARYETPGGSKFAETILPHVKNCNTIILANHGTLTFGPTLENAYFNTEIIDAYCKILILARQIGKVNYFTPQETKELLDLKKKLGYDDPRLKGENCDLCANNTFGRCYSEAVPAEVAAATSSAPQLPAGVDFERLVQAVTDQVMKTLAKAS
jgi:L-fuculose-phosphate aldolase